MSTRPVRRLLPFAVLCFVLAPSLLAQIPPGYYDTVDSSNSTTLRSTLHEVIDDHTRFPYTSGSTDTWNILELADEDPNNASRILDIYRNASYPKAGGGNSNYNREHTWPSSYGFPDDDGSNYPFTDCHSLRLCDDGYNTARSNRPNRICDAVCSESPTFFNDGRGGGSGTYPGNSNWSRGSFENGTWEVWGGRRGDVARSIFYMDIRYEGGNHGGTGAPEPNLIVTNNGSLITSSSSNQSVAYMGILSVLLQWHLEDPVDDDERARNDIVYGFQGNRNPFVDHPEWAECLFSNTCGGAPAAPSGLTATGGDGFVDLDWNDNFEGDLAGYNVYRSTVSGGSYTQLNGALLLTSGFLDPTVNNGTTYYYVVTAENTSVEESGFSDEASATPAAESANTEPWINEIHYDNDGADIGERVEIGGPSGLDLTGWVLAAYDGVSGGAYQTLPLGGTLPNGAGCVGVLSFDFSGLEDGSPDGLALVDPQGTVIEFLSYEGFLFALSGPAAGKISIDIGVSESPTTPVGLSLQRTGVGDRAADFTWLSPSVETPGSVNVGQTFDGCIGDSTPPATPTGLVATASDNQVALDWDDNAENDLLGYIVYRSTVMGGPYGTLTGSPIFPSSLTDTSAINGTTYYYVVSAVDISDNESPLSAEVSATPGPPPIANVWINELHYQNVGTDVGELVEVAGTPGQSLSGWTLVAYNGFTGLVYQSIALNGTIPSDGSCAGVRTFAFSGMQDGDPDGLALVDHVGRLIEFWSYGGSFVAGDGPAAGIRSIDIGFFESASNPVGWSLQLSGTGSQASDFAWQAPAPGTARSANNGQTFQGCGGGGGQKTPLGAQGVGATVTPGQ